VLRATVASEENCNSREICNGKTRVGVEVLRFYEALKQIPTHLGRLIGAQQGGGRGLVVRCLQVACGKMQGSTGGDEELRIS
jgi:hypothetical protein